MMLNCGPEKIPIFRIGLQLGVTPSDIPKIGFAIVLNWISTYSRSPYGDDQDTSSPSPWGSTGTGRK
jgi:hypothetical protein